MEKRLPLALLLSVLVIVGWSLLVDPPEPPVGDASRSLPTEVDSAGAAGAAEAAEAAEAVMQPVVDEPTIGQRIAAGEEEELTLRFGVPGEVGSFAATFSNRGGVLRELHIGNWYDRVGLSEEEKLQPEHWVPMLLPLQEAGQESLALKTSPASEEYVRKGEPLETALWTMEPLGPPGRPEGVRFVFGPGKGLRFEKRVRHLEGTYSFQVELEIENEGAPSGKTTSFLLTPASVVPRVSEDNFYQGPQAIAAGRRATDKPLIVESEKRKVRGGGGDITDTFRVPATPLSFAGVHNKYFAVLFRGADDASRASLQDAVWRRVADPNWFIDNPGGAPEDSFQLIAVDLPLAFDLPAVGESVTFDYRLYAGPKIPDELGADHVDEKLLVDEDLKSFVPGVSTIAKGVLFVLGLFHDLTGNYGVAIILLTLCLRAMLFPLNRRSQTSMARHQTKMKRIQPQMDEIKKRWEKDSKKMRAEQTKLMQKEGAFPPVGGCLPVFLQLPVFFGLFLALRTSFVLRQAPFAGWIDDLSMADRLMKIDFNTHLPFIGTIEYLNVLPPVMVVLWVLQQKVMPKPADEQAARMQKMMLFMPVVMGFFLYNYAAGLSLYMITQSGLGIFEMGFIKKKWPLDDSEVVANKSKEGFMARLAERAEQQQKTVEAAKKQRSNRGGGKGRKRKGA